MRFMSRAPRALAVVVGGTLTMCAVALSPRLPLSVGVGVAGAGTAQERPGGGTGSTGTPLKVLVLFQDQPSPHGATVGVNVVFDTGNSTLEGIVPIMNCDEGGTP